MDLRTIAMELNRRCGNFKMNDFQKIRTDIKVHNLTRINPYKIFSYNSIKDIYAFHSGGRKELQYNIAIEEVDNKDYLRYGVAFSLESGPHLGLDEIEKIFLHPPPYPNRIKRYNEFLESKYFKYLPRDLKFWSYHYGNRGEIKDIHKIDIENKSAILGKFYFIGKLMPLKNLDYDEILSTFDKLLPLYIYVEGSNIEDFDILSYPKKPYLKEDTSTPIGDDEFDLLTVDTSFPPDIDEAEEGRRILRKHYSRERNPTIIKMAKKRKKDQYGELRCEVCNILFFDVYGDHGKDFIEGHHIKPISKMRPGDKTNIEDIALLCSNCHRMIHKNMEPLTIEELKNMIRYKWE